MKKYNWKRLRHLCVLPVFAIALLTGLSELDYDTHLTNIIYSTGPSRCSTPVCSCPGGLVIRPSLSRVPSLKYVASYQDELDANNVLQYVGTFD